MSNIFHFRNCNPCFFSSVFCHRCTFVPLRFPFLRDHIQKCPCRLQHCLPPRLLVLLAICASRLQLLIYFLPVIISPNPHMAIVSACFPAFPRSYVRISLARRLPFRADCLSPSAPQVALLVHTYYHIAPCRPFLPFFLFLINYLADSPPQVTTHKSELDKRKKTTAVSKCHARCSWQKFAARGNAQCAGKLIMF